MIIGNIYIDDIWNSPRNGNLLGRDIAVENAEFTWYKISYHCCDASFLKSRLHQDKNRIKIKINDKAYIATGCIEIFPVDFGWKICFENSPFIENQYVNWYDSTDKTFNSILAAQYHFDNFLNKLLKLKVFL